MTSKPSIFKVSVTRTSSKRVTITAQIVNQLIWIVSNNIVIRSKALDLYRAINKRKDHNDALMTNHTLSLWAMRRTKTSINHNMEKTKTKMNTNKKRRKKRSSSQTGQSQRSLCSRQIYR